VSEVLEGSGFGAHPAVFEDADKFEMVGDGLGGVDQLLQGVVAPDVGRGR